MKSAKIISIFLLFVFVLQMLPVKQAVRYFYIDNVMAEEILHDTKEPVKTGSFFESNDDHFLNASFYLAHPYLIVSIKSGCSGKAMFPSLHAEDIETPPPNFSLS